MPSDVNGRKRPLTRRAEIGLSLLVRGLSSIKEKADLQYKIYTQTPALTFA